MQFIKVLSLTILLGFMACSTPASETKEAAKSAAQAAKPAAQEQSVPVTQKSPAEQMNADKELISNYVASNGLKGQYTESGIFYMIETPGEGPNPVLQSTVTCHYKGTLLNGKQFDSSYDRGQPASFPLMRVIKGWQEGIPLLKKGGKGKFIIPSGLAYGAVSRGPSLPANSVLIFDVELMEFK